MEKDYWKGLLWGLVLVGIIHLLFGCSRTVYVPVESVSHDTLYMSKVERDSVFLRDSVYLYDHIQGDTVCRDKVVFRYIYRSRTSTDTVVAVRCDTVSVPVTTVRELGWWERTRLRLFVPLMTLTVGVTFIVVWLARKRV